jgi:hypothetical protein
VITGLLINNFKEFAVTATPIITDIPLIGGVAVNKPLRSP